VENGLSTGVVVGGIGGLGTLYSLTGVMKRVRVYLKEMFPPFARLCLAVMVFFEIYFLVVLTNRSQLAPTAPAGPAAPAGVPLNLGWQEVIGAVTIFAFLLTLRIVDDLKDYYTDQRLFPHRAVPSGRVLRRDIVTVMIAVDTPVIVANLLWMNNPVWFVVLAVYGTALSMWFFARGKIQPNLPLALVTHNPVQIVMNLYIISFACYKFDIPMLTLPNAAIALTLYFPGLIWEISRKVRAPEDETEYVTYSKLFGVRRPVVFILVVMAFDVITTSYLVYRLYPWSITLVIAAYLWLVWQAVLFIRQPGRWPLVQRVQWYEYVAEGTVVALIAAHLAGWGG
jgi:4-hydroxybenzoate polyprenyltransferase